VRPIKPVEASWRTSAAVALMSFAGTRVPVLAIGALAAVMIGTSPAPTSEALWRVSPGEIGNLLARWDTAWYLSIATDGYRWDPSAFRHQNVVFFPLYPMLMRWGGRLIGGHPLLAGLIVSLASFTAAMVLLYRLAAAELGEQQAWPVVLLISTYPFALFYSAVYTESLFLFVTVGAFYAMRRDQPALAAGFGLAAGLTRPNGMWLAVPLLWMAFERRGSGPPWRRLSAIGASLTPIVGTLAYSAYLLFRFGDGLAWVHGQAAWGLPLVLRWGAQEVPFVRAPGQLYTDILRWIGDIAAFVVAAAAIRPIWKRFGPPYALWVALAIVPPVMTHLFMSLGRFTAVLFPLFFWLATVVPRSQLWRWAAWFAAIQAGLAVLFFLWQPIV
jgi:Mannosyltransferase (PIG-V)